MSTEGSVLKKLTLLPCSAEFVLVSKTDRIHIDWRDSTLYSECAWHQLSPYIGRMKSSMAKSLITQFSEAGDTVYDPFCGAGTVALEAWIAGRNVIAGDLSPYAHILARAKLYPPRSIADAIRRLDTCWQEAVRQRQMVDMRRVPKWVRAFFHIETLREVIALRNVLVDRHQWFLLSCLLGIVHHWRPGFLSHPASHTVPYLLHKRYPRSEYPEMYGHRQTYPRLLAKVRRAFNRCPNVNRALFRIVRRTDAISPHNAVAAKKVSAIVTSPPYMNSLSYARDNRLRLWLVGETNHKSLEPLISPRKNEFLAMMRDVFPKWSSLLPKDGPCVLVLGAVSREGKHYNLPDEVVEIARDSHCGFRVTEVCKNVIPNHRRTRINCRSTREDTILVLRKQG